MTQQISNYNPVNSSELELITKKGYKLTDVEQDIPEAEQVIDLLHEIYLGMKANYFPSMKMITFEMHQGPDIQIYEGMQVTKITAETLHSLVSGFIREQDFTSLIKSLHQLGKHCNEY